MHFRLESVLRRLGLFFLGVSLAVLLFLDGAALALQFDAQRITQYARAQHGESVAQGVYVAGAATRPVDRIGHWRDLMSRMENEGFSP